MTSRSARVLAGTRQAALTVAAVAGVLCLLVAVGGFAFGVRPLVFRSGSMEPVIGTGAFAIAHQVDADRLHKGDVVSVPTQGGDRVTHRIVSIEHHDGQAILQLKGDANEVADASPYLVEHGDVVLFSVPKLGYALSWLTGPAGLFLLGLYAAFLLSVIARGGASRRPLPAVAVAVPVDALPHGRRRLEKSDVRHRGARPALVVPLTTLFRGKNDARHRLVRPAASHRRSADARHRVARPVNARPVVVRREKNDARHRIARPAFSLPLTAVTVPVMALTLASGTLAIGWTDPTQAAWTDAVTVSGTTQTTYTVPAPDGTSCAVLAPGSSSSRGVNLTWPANVAPLPLLSYTAATTGLSGGSATVVTVGSNKQLQVRYNPSTVANQNKTVTVTATPRLTSTATWTGPVTTWKFRTGGTSAVQPICGEATAAVVVIRAPDGVTRTPTAQRAFISGASGCTTDVAMCGTIDDASTISSVTYVLQRTQPGPIVRCFNGTAWVVSCTPVTASSTVHLGVLTFYEDTSTATVYPNTGTGSYTLTVTVTDSWANVSATVVSFTLN